MRKFYNILSAIASIIVCFAISSCSDENNEIGGFTPIDALILDVVDEEGNSLVDKNNPNNILSEGIKAIENGTEYPLIESEEMIPQTNIGTASRATAPPRFIGLFLSDKIGQIYSGPSLYNPNPRPYIAFGQFEPKQALHRKLTLYLPTYPDGIDIEYVRKKVSGSDKDEYKTTTTINGVVQTEEIPRIVIR